MTDYHNKKKLSPKQVRFCQEYVVDLNATQAAIRAGYSVKTAYSIGNENLKKPEIKNFISELQKDIQERNKITIDECVNMLSSMARFDISELYDENGCLKPISKMPKEARMVIEGIDTNEVKIDGKSVGVINKLKLSSRRANIIELMKHLGGYEKDNNQKELNNVVIFNIPDNGRS